MYTHKYTHTCMYIWAASPSFLHIWLKRTLRISSPYDCFLLWNPQSLVHAMQAKLVSWYFLFNTTAIDLRQVSAITMVRLLWEREEWLNFVWHAPNYNLASSKRWSYHLALHMCRHVYIYYAYIVSIHVWFCF